VRSSAVIGKVKLTTASGFAGKCLVKVSIFIFYSSEQFTSHLVVEEYLFYSRRKETQDPRPKLQSSAHVSGIKNVLIVWAIAISHWDLQQVKKYSSL
jgi:hypothetical protein